MVNSFSRSPVLLLIAGPKPGWGALGAVQLTLQEPWLIPRSHCAPARDALKCDCAADIRFDHPRHQGY